MKDKISGYKVWMNSVEYGAEDFGPYDTLSEAYRAIARLATACAKPHIFPENDAVLRTFEVQEEEGQDEEGE